MIISRRTLLQALAVGAVSAMAPPIPATDKTGNTREAIAKQEEHFSALGKYDFFMRSLSVAMLPGGDGRIAIEATGARCRMDATIVTRDFAIYNDLHALFGINKPVTLDWRGDVYTLNGHRLSSLTVAPECLLIDVTSLSDDVARYIPR